MKYGIYANNSVTINGGQVTANGGTKGISSKGNITLGWTKPTNFIYANSYMAFGGTLSIADGQSFYNGSEVLSGAFATNTDKSKLDGKTLTLNFDDAPETIPAGTPFIVKWTGADVSNPVFSGVTVSSGNNDVDFTGGAFKGSYSYMEWAAGTEYKSILLLGANSKLFWPNGENASRLGACRAYFELSDGVSAREFVLNFNGDATGVRLIDNGKLKIENEAGAWYDLQGRRLDAQPTKAGVYIHGGCKVVVP